MMNVYRPFINPFGDIKNVLGVLWSLNILKCKGRCHTANGENKVRKNVYLIILFYIKNNA